jgi:hypothetical protein
VLAALSPTAFLVIAVYLGSARPAGVVLTVNGLTGLPR